MSYKIRVSKAGYSVESETDLNNIVFDSDYDTLKYSTSGTKDVTYPDTSGSPDEYEEVVVTHSLGYIPVFFCNLKDTNFSPDHYYLLPLSFADGFDYLYLDVYATTTQLIFRAKHSGTFDAVTLTLYYRIFKNDTGV